jgi:hypothetical protein
VSTGVSEEHIASIFRVEEKAEQETSVKAGGKQGKGLYGVISQKIVLFINILNKMKVIIKGHFEKNV